MATTVQELLKKRKEREAQAEAGASPSASSGVQKLLEQRRAAYAASVQQEIVDRTTKWLENSNTYIKNYQNRVNHRADGVYVDDAGEAFDRYSEQLSRFETEAAAIKQGLDTYGAYYDPEFVKQITDILDGSSKTQAEIIKNLQADRDYWSKWSGEEEYNKAYDNTIYGKRYDGASYAEIMKALERTVGREKAWLEKNRDSYMSSEDAQAEIDRLKAEMDAENKDKSVWGHVEDFVGSFFTDAETGEDNETKKYHDRIATLEGIRDAAKRKEIVAQYDQYKQPAGEMAAKIQALLSQEQEQKPALDVDFPKSEEVDKERGRFDLSVFENGDHEVDENVVKGLGFSSIEDFEAWKKNAEKSDDERLLDKVRNRSSQNRLAKYFDALQNPKIGSQFSIDDYAGRNANWKYLEKEEIQVYNYLLLEYGREKADQYLSDMEVELDRRAAVKADEELAKDIEEGGALTSLGYTALSVLTKPVSGIASLLDNAVQSLEGALNGKPYNPYSEWQSGRRLTSGIRQNVSQKIDKAVAGTFLEGKIFGQNTMSFLYNTVMSATDSLIGATTLGSLYTIAMAGDASGEMAEKLYEQGASGSQIFTRSLAAGLAEYITEKVSVERLLDFKNPAFKGQIAIEILKQAGVEATEEMASDVLNLIADSVIMASQSDMAQAIQRYTEGYYDENGVYHPGVSKEEATKKAWGDFFIDTLADGLAGAISGGLGGSVSVGVQAGQNVKAGKQVIKAGRAAELIEKGQAAADGSQAKKIADRLAKQKEAGKALSPMAVGALKQTKLQDLADSVGKRQYASRAEIEQALADAEVENPIAMAESLDRAQRGEADADDMAIIEGNDKAARVLQRIQEENELRMLSKTAEAMTEMDRIDSLTSPEFSRYDSEKKGATTLTESGETVVIEGVKAARDGELTFRLADGREVSSTDVTFASGAEAELYAELARSEIQPGVMKNVVDHFNGETSAKAYVRGMETAYLYGWAGIPAGQLASLPQLAGLNEAQRGFAYDLGRVRALDEDAKKTTRLKNLVEASRKIKNGKKGRVILEGVSSRHALTERQKASKGFCELAAKILGINIHLFESDVQDGVRGYTPKDGGLITDNGFYDPVTGDIWLDINAGAEGRGLTVFTLAHELAHFIRQWSPEKFRILSDFLMETYGKKGVSVEELISAQRAYAKEQGRELTFREAWEEVVGDSMETLLNDGRVMERIAALKKRDGRLADKIMGYIRRFVDRVTAAYENEVPDSEEGKTVAGWAKEEIEALQDRFADALYDASETFQKTDVSRMETSEGVRFQDRKIRELNSSKKKIENNIEYVSKMSAVYAVDKSKLEKSGKRPSDTFAEQFKSWGNYLYSEELGHISVEKSSVKSEVRHGITAEKIASIEAIPSVIEKGKVIFVGQKSESGLLRIVVGAPITIAEKPYYMGIMLQRDARFQRLYLHNVAIVKEASEISQDDLLTTGAHENNENLSMTSILQNALAVKYKNEIIFDITEIKNITNDNIGQSIIKNAAKSIRDVSNNSVPQSDSTVNSQDTQNSKKYSTRRKAASDEKTDVSQMETSEGVKNQSLHVNAVERAAETNSDVLYSQRKKKVDAAVDKAIKNKGDLGVKYNQERISEFPADITAVVSAASEGRIDLAGKYIAINGDDIWHEYQSHSDASVEVGRRQLPQTVESIKESVMAIYAPDVVESLFTTNQNPTQRQSFAYAKKSPNGYYIVVEAVGGKKNPNVVPVMLLQFTEEKWNDMMSSGMTLGELLFENDEEKRNSLDVDLNKKNRVTVAQFASKEAIANTPRSPRFKNSIPQSDDYVNTTDEYLNSKKYSTRRRVASDEKTDVSRMETSEVAGHDGQERTYNDFSASDYYQNSELYSYDFLTRQKDMEAVNLPKTGALAGKNGRIDDEKVIENGKKNAIAEGIEKNGKIYVANTYTGRSLRIDVQTIRHGLDGTYSRHLTNARIGSMIGSVVKNAIPVNGLKNTAEKAVGTYAMVSYCHDSMGRQFIAVITVEQYSDNVESFELYDVAHAVSGRQKKSSQVDTKSQGVNPIKAATISIADLLQIVKSTHQSILSDNVLARLGEKRNPKGSYTDKVLFSTRRKVASDEKTDVSRMETAEEQAQRAKNNPYEGKKLYENGEVYDYSFMASLDPMVVKSLPPLSSVKDNGRISQTKAVSLGLESAKRIGKEITPTQYAIKNAYTKRDIILGTNGLNHSLDASNISRLRTNARLSSIGGYVVQNAVPINGLKKENKQAEGTYAMACLLKDGDGYVVAIVTVDEFSSHAIDFDVVEVTHSINGRFIPKEGDSRSSTRELELGQESPSTTTISKISIADFLEIVNRTHRSILSDDVLKHFGEDRSDGHDTDRDLFSTRRRVASDEKTDVSRMETSEGVKYSSGKVSRFSARADGDIASAIETANSQMFVKTEENGGNIDRRYEITSDTAIEEDNIANGRNALFSLLRIASASENSQDLKIENAMYRTDIGSIDFVWGVPGTGKKYKRGYGISHIIKKRDAENGSGLKTANKLVEVIAKATIVEIQNNPVSRGNGRIKLVYDGYTAVLSQSETGNHWLLTGWEDAKETTTRANGEVRDSTVATAVTPTLSRRNGGAVVSNEIIAPFPQNVNSENMETSKKSSTRRERTSARALLEGVDESEIADRDVLSELREYKETLAALDAAEARYTSLKHQAQADDEPTEVKTQQEELRRAKEAVTALKQELYRMELGKALSGILDQERAEANKQGAKAAAEYRRQEKERRDVAVSRDKLKKKVIELSRLLNRSTKKKRVLSDMQRPVEEILSVLANAPKRTEAEYDRQIAELKAEVSRCDLDLAELRSEMALVDGRAEDAETIRKRIKAAELERDAYENRIAKALAERDVETGGAIRLIEAITNLKAVYDRLATEEDTLDAEELDLYDQRISEKLGWTLETLREGARNGEPLSAAAKWNLLLECAAVVERAVRRGGRLFDSQRSQSLTEIRQSVYAELASQDRKTRREGRSGLRKLLKSSKKFNLDNLQPDVLLQFLGSEELRGLATAAADAELTYGRDVDEANGFFHKVAEETGFFGWNREERIPVVFDGKETSVSLGELMSLYALYRRPAGKRHLIEGGGFTHGTDQTEKTALGEVGISNEGTYQPTETELRALLREKLTEEQRRFVERMTAYLSKEMARKGNRVSQIFYGIDLFGDPHYFPMKVDENYRSNKDEDKRGGNKVSPRIVSRGMTKPLDPKATAPLVVSDFFTVWSGHVGEMAAYHGAVGLENFTRVWEGKFRSAEGKLISLKTEVKRLCGEDYVKYIDTWIEHCNRNIRRGEGSMEGFDKLVRGYKKAATYAKLSVVVQQGTSEWRAYQYIPKRYFEVFHRRLLPGQNKALWEEMKKHCPLAVLKEMGGYDMTGGSLASYMLGPQTRIEKIEDFLGRAPAWADELTWVRIWQAGKNMAADRLRDPQTKVKPSLDSEEVLALASELVTECLRKTQVYDSVYVRSGHMRNPSYAAKAGTAFMGEPTVAINNLAEGALHVARGIGKKNYKVKTRGREISALRSFIEKWSTVWAASTLAGVAAALVKALEDDDEEDKERTYLEKLAPRLADAVWDPWAIVNMLPYARDLLSLSRGYGATRPELQLVEDFIDTVQKFEKAASAEEKDGEMVANRVIDVATEAASFTKIPIRNLVKTVRGLIATFSSPALWETDHAGIMGALKDWNDAEMLYQAYLDGDQKAVERYTSRFKDEDGNVDVSLAREKLRAVIRDRDVRVREATDYRMAGNLTLFEELMSEMKGEKIFDANLLISAVNSEENAVRREQKKTASLTVSDKEVTVLALYYAVHVNEAFERGDTEDALHMIEEIVSAKMENGKTEKEARAEMKRGMTSYWKDLYVAGDKTRREEIINILVASGLYGTKSKVRETVGDWLKA